MQSGNREGAFPVKLAVAMVAFLSGLFLAGASLSEAAAGKKKSPETAKSAVEYTEGRIKVLGSALKITEDQEMAWGNLTQVMRENAQDMDALTEARAENARTMNAVERMKFHSQVTQAHLDQQKKLIPVFETLYASMSDAQKAATDEIFVTGKHGKNKLR